MEEKKGGRRKKLIMIYVRGFIAGLIVCVALVYLFPQIFPGGTVLPKETKDYYDELDDAYGKYYEITKLIGEEALADFEPKKVDDKVLKDLVDSLDDPYAEYFTAEEYAVFERRFMDEYVGIGVSITDRDGRVVVVDTVEDGPADVAGVKIDDVILKIDGKKVKDSDDASMKMSGDADTEVRVRIQRGSREKVLKITRAEIEQDSVSYEKYDKKNKIGYIKIDMFKIGTCKEFKLAVKDLKNAGYDRIMIDLRRNGGGLTDEAYKLADYLLPECKTIIEENKQGKKTVHKSKPSSAGIEYVLLVDEGTASASEMVTAAVKDNKGGKVIGTVTYGKGVTQKTHKFEDGSALKITIEEFYGPETKINEVGIRPDIELKHGQDAELIAVQELLK